jgi:hypothetical protein
MIAPTSSRSMAFSLTIRDPSPPLHPPRSVSCVIGLMPIEMDLEISNTMPTFVSDELCTYPRTTRS